MAFFLFLLLNAVLFIRPTEFVPGLIGLPLYNVLILTCLASSSQAILRQLRGDVLIADPISACVLGVFVAALLSHLSHFNFEGVRSSGFEFAKVMVYYLLLVGLVDSVERMRRLLRWLGWLILGLTSLALLQYHGFIALPALESMQENVFTSEGELVGAITRLCSTGIYHNPNGLSRILVTGIILSLYWLGDRPSGRSRVVWLVPLLTEGYALVLTQSRGGFMDMAAAILCLLYARYGGKWAAVLGCTLGPAALVVFKGRQTTISLSEGTGHQRVLIWTKGWALLRGAPVFGIGMDHYVKEVGYVAHNSFFHCYAELGLLGGTFYTGMFYLAISGVLRVGTFQSPVQDFQLRRMGPYLAAALAGEAVGMFSITTSYEVPTYLLIGLAAVYLRLVEADPRAEVPRLTGRLAARVLVTSFCMISLIYLIIRRSYE